MPENYITCQDEKGSINISEEVISALVRAAVTQVEGVAGLSNTSGAELVELIGIKTLSKGVRLTASDTGALRIDCDIVSNFGQNIFELAKNVQENVKSSVESVTGLCVAEVNVTICGIALPKETKK